MNEIFVSDWQQALVRKHPGGTAQHILLALSIFMADEGYCAGAIKGIASVTGRSERCVHRHLLQAEAAGWIKRDKLGKGRNWRRSVYWPKIPMKGTGGTG